MNTIKSRLIKDGNSTAVRIPKDVLKMSGLSGDVDLNVRKGRIIVSRRKHPRAGWDEKIRATNQRIKTVAKTDPELTDWDEAAGDGL